MQQNARLNAAKCAKVGLNEDPKNCCADASRKVKCYENAEIADENALLRLSIHPHFSPFIVLLLLFFR